MTIRTSVDGNTDGGARDPQRVARLVICVLVLAVGTGMGLYVLLSSEAFSVPVVSLAAAVVFGNAITMGRALGRWLSGPKDRARERRR